MANGYDPKKPGGIDVNFNDAVAFFVELIALVILAIWAWQLFPDHLVARTVAVVVVVGVVAVSVVVPEEVAGVEFAVSVVVVWLVSGALAVSSFFSSEQAASVTASAATAAPVRRRFIRLISERDMVSPVGREVEFLIRRRNPGHFLKLV